MPTIAKPNPTLIQLIVWKSAIKLEKLGMKRRGRLVLSIAKEHFGMPKRATHDEVIARIQKEIDNAEL
jgi:hypothetical protein